MENKIKPKTCNLLVNSILALANHCSYEYYFATTIFWEELYSIDNQIETPEKAVLLTFFDAYSDYYINVFPILDRFRLQGSFYTPAKATSEYKILDVNKIHFV